MISGATQSEGQPTVEISSTVRVLRKRGGPSSSSPDGVSTRVGRSSSHICEALQMLDARLACKLQEKQQPALQQIVTALERECPPGQFSAVCIHTGTSAAAGDSSSFEAALQYIETTCVGAVFIVRLHPSRHDSLRAVADAVAAAPAAARLVVAVEHAHLFHADLLSDVVYLLAHRCSQSTPDSGHGTSPTVSPVAGVFAVPHANALHDCLTVRDASTLAATLVRMPSPHDAFDAVVDSLSTYVGVVYSVSVFRAIENHFFLNDTSLSMLTRTLRQAVTLHYASSPLMDMCGWIDGLNRQTAVTRVRQVLLNFLRDENTLKNLDMLPSVASHSCKPKQCGDSVDERAIVYLGFFEALASWKRTVATLNGLALKTETLFHNVDGEDSASSERFPPPTLESLSRRTAIFKHFLPENENIAPGTRYLAALLKTVKSVPRSELRRFLTFLEHELHSFPVSLDEQSNSTLSLTERVAELITQLDGSKPQGVNCNNNPEEILAATQGYSTPVRGTGNGRGRMASGAAAAAARRQQTLLNSAQKAKQAGPLSLVREEISLLLRELFARATPLCSLPCHEIILFDDVDALSVASGGLCCGAEPRNSIFNALRQPSSALGALPAHRDPDATVAFRILAEGGRLVSLYDWYNIFASMRTAANMASQESQTIPIPPAEMQARFARACSELELVGLLKYTNRKTDHVARLAFE